jgi:PAS domain S-box-containing protein
LTVCVLRNSTGDATGFSATIRDISERRRMLSELQESERMMATLLSNLPGYAYKCRNDPDGTWDFISEGVFELTGYSVDEYLVERTINRGEKTHPDDRDGVWNEVQSALDAKRPFECIYRILTKSDDVKWVWEKGRGIYSPDCQLLHIEGFVMDITIQKNVEEARQESEDRLRLLLDSTAESIYGVDLNGDCIFSNAACVRLLGYDGESDLLGKNMHELIHHTRLDGSKYHAGVQHIAVGDNAVSKAGLAFIEIGLHQFFG